MLAAEEIIYITIIEDNKFVRNGWKITLENTIGFRVSGSFESCEDAFSNGDFKMTDIVIMDIGLPGISGIEGVRYLKENFPGLLIIMCTVHDEDEDIFKALCAGAVGYLLKKVSSEELVNAIRDAYKGGSPMTPEVARKVITAFQRSDEQIRLTEREMNILELMAQGKSYAIIAGDVHLSLDGVYYHIRHIYEKLHVHSRGEAVAKGIKKRLIPPF